MMTPTSLQRLLLVALSLNFTAALADASTLAVNFGGDYTAANINAAFTPSIGDFDADFDGLADDRVANIPFGTTFGPPNSANWNTPLGASGAEIKQGVSVGLLNWNSASDPQPAINLNRISATDIIQVTSGIGTSALRMASAIYWEKPSFLNGQHAIPSLSFADDAASITANFNNAGTPTNAGGRLSRILAQSGGSWYVSATVFGSTNGTLTFNGAATDWYAFDPAAGTMFWDTANPGSAIAGSMLNDITALGIYTQHELISGTSASAANQGFSRLQVMVIPEPSTYALLSVCLVLALAFRRRLT